MTLFYKKLIDRILGEEPLPSHVFDCTSLVWITPIGSVPVKHDEWRVYFYVFFSSGLKLNVYVDTHTDYSEHLSSIRKLFINAIGHSYLPLYEKELTIGDSTVKLTEYE